MCFGILRGQPRRFARLAHRAQHISFLQQSTGQIHVRLRETRIPFHGRLELGNSGVDFALREQNPSKRVVRFWALRNQLDRLFERRSRTRQILPLQRFQALTVKRIGSCSVGVGIRIFRLRVLSGANQEKHQYKRANSQPNHLPARKFE